MKTIARMFGFGGSAATEATTPVAEVPVVAIEPGEGEILHLSVGDIVPNPFQPRKTFAEEPLQELAASIREFGVLQPLLVRRSDNGYELIAGERRLRASRLAGLAEVPVLLKELTDKEMAEIAMIENLQREDLHFMEEAEGFHQLLQQFGFTQDELARRVGKSQSTIANKLRLLRLDGAVRDQLLAHQLTERHARALLKLESTEQQLGVVSVICEQGMNVREAEMLIEQTLCPPAQTGESKQQRQNVVKIIKDVRIFLNSIRKIAGDLRKTGLPVTLQEEQDDQFIHITMRIPKRRG